MGLVVFKEIIVDEEGMREKSEESALADELIEFTL